MDDLKKVSNLLHGHGEIMPGIEMSLEEALARIDASGLSAWTPFCVVRDWIWIDLILPDSLREQLRAEGQQPVMIYSHSVLYDSSRRFDVGDWVRTTQLVEFTDGCFFRTRNTVYVLAGDGVRKEAELSTVLKIF